MRRAPGLLVQRRSISCGRYHWASNVGKLRRTHTQDTVMNHQVSMHEPSWCVSQAGWLAGSLVHRLIDVHVDIFLYLCALQPAGGRGRSRRERHDYFRVAFQTLGRNVSCGRVTREFAVGQLLTNVSEGFASLVHN